MCSPFPFIEDLIVFKLKLNLINWVCLCTCAPALVSGWILSFSQTQVKLEIYIYIYIYIYICVCTCSPFPFLEDLIVFKLKCNLNNWVCLCTSAPALVSCCIVNFSQTQVKLKKYEFVYVHLFLLLKI